VIILIKAKVSSTRSQRYIASALDGGVGLASGPCRSTPGRDPGNPLTGDWVNPRTGMDVLEKKNIFLLSAFEPGTFQPIA